jgi:hypothetical protein
LGILANLRHRKEKKSEEQNDIEAFHNTEIPLDTFTQRKHSLPNTTLKMVELEDVITDGDDLEINDEDIKVVDLGDNNENIKVEVNDKDIKVVDLGVNDEDIRVYDFDIEEYGVDTEEFETDDDFN